MNTRFLVNVGALRASRSIYFGTVEIAAFFDLDNTVVRGSSMLPFAWRLVRSGRVSTSEMFRFASMNARFVRTRTESASGRDYAMQRALALAAGLGELKPARGWTLFGPKGFINGEAEKGGGVA